jgi:hypothetical protein
MASLGKHTVNVSDAFRGNRFLIELRVRRDWRFRLAMMLFWLAGRVLRCKVGVCETITDSDWQG